MVRAKFRCIESTRRYTHTSDAGLPTEVDHVSYRVRLVPVMSKSKGGGYGDCEENKAFYAATPSGEIVLDTINPSAAEQFVPGQAFYIDFTPADG